jgi:hypothetical protein
LFVVDVRRDYEATGGHLIADKFGVESLPLGDSADCRGDASVDRCSALRVVAHFSLPSLV